MPENANKITVDFFHDAVCCWCFNMSFRLRTLADEFDLDIRHRTFVLQDSVEAMRRHWGSSEQARARILEHWDACREVSDRPEMIDVDAMRNAGFDYPHGFQAALACKAAERLFGQTAHWDMFDAIQRAHFTEARNIADADVLLDVAQSLGYEKSRFAAEMNTPMTFAEVQADRRAAWELHIRVIPHISVRETGQCIVSGSLDEVRRQLVSLRSRGPLPSRPRISDSITRGR